MRETIIQGVKIRYRWLAAGREVERCPLCGKPVPKINEDIVRKSIGDENWKHMKTLAKYIEVRDKLIRDVKGRKLTLKELQDRWRPLSKLEANVVFIVASLGKTVTIFCEKCGDPLLCQVEASVDNNPPAYIDVFDILMLDEGSERLKYFIKRELGMFWPEIRKKVIEENDRQLAIAVKAFLAENMIFKPIIT